MIGIRLKEADSEGSRCQDIIFYRKKHRCFKSLATLTYAEKMKAHKCKVQMVTTESTQVQMMTTWQKTSIGDDDMDADEGKWI